MRRTTVVIVTAVLAATAGGAAGAGVDGSAGACRVSRTTAHPVAGRPSFNLGNGRVAVALPRGARYVAVPEGSPGGAFVQPDGWIRTKVGWWTLRGAPRVTGRRLDRPAKQLRADVGSLSLTASGTFYPSLLYFPSTGCWRITATAAGGRLVAVVHVVAR